MSLLLTGDVERITQRQAGRPGEQWTEHTAIVKDWGVTQYVTLSGDFVEKDANDQPTGRIVGIAEGDKVALDIGVRAYVRTKGEGAGYGVTAFRRNQEAEQALYGRQLKAATGS